MQQLFRRLDDQVGIFRAEKFGASRSIEHGHSGHLGVARTLKVKNRVSHKDGIRRRDSKLLTSKERTFRVRFWIRHIGSADDNVDGFGRREVAHQMVHFSLVSAGDEGHFSAGLRHLAKGFNGGSERSFEVGVSLISGQSIFHARVQFFRGGFVQGEEAHLVAKGNPHQRFDKASVGSRPGVPFESITKSGDNHFERVHEGPVHIEEDGPKIADGETPLHCLSMADRGS